MLPVSQSLAHVPGSLSDWSALTVATCAQAPLRRSQRCSFSLLLVSTSALCDCALSLVSHFAPFLVSDHFTVGVIATLRHFGPRALNTRSRLRFSSLLSRKSQAQKSVSIVQWLQIARLCFCFFFVFFCRNASRVALSSCPLLKLPYKHSHALDTRA